MDEKNYEKVYDNCVTLFQNSKCAPQVFQYLLDIKTSLLPAQYGKLVRKYFKQSTYGLSKKFLSRVFEGTTREDLMTKNEIEEFNSLPEIVTIYRGAKKSEEIPRFSWSLKRYVAEDGDFYDGRLFIANINKDQILMYYNEDAEYEVVVNIEDGYRVIDDE